MARKRHRNRVQTPDDWTPERLRAAVETLATVPDEVISTVKEKYLQAGPLGEIAEEHLQIGSDSDRAQYENLLLEAAASYLVRVVVKPADPRPEALERLKRIAGLAASLKAEFEAASDAALYLRRWLLIAAPAESDAIVVRLHGDLEWLAKNARWASERIVLPHGNLDEPTRDLVLGLGVVFIRFGPPLETQKYRELFATFVLDVLETLEPDRGRRDREDELESLQRQIRKILGS